MSIWTSKGSRYFDFDNSMYGAQCEAVKNSMKIHGSTAGYFSSVGHVVNDLFVIFSVNKELGKDKVPKN